MEKIGWTDIVRNEEVLHTVEVMRNILQKLRETRITNLFKSCVGTAF